MKLEDVRALSARDLADALGQLGIEQGWEIGDSITQSAFLDPSGPCLPEPAPRRKDAFQNLVVGTIAEHVFRDQHLAKLSTAGFKVVDYHERGENRDYAVERDELELPINVKVASTMFREARRVVALDPEDCIPVGAYKAIGASERVPDLIYVFLVDFQLRERVDAFMDSLEGPLEVGWHLLSWYGGKGAKVAQDRYVSTLFNQHAPRLTALAPGGSSYRVISAQRVLAIMRKMPRRVPGLGVKAAGSGVFQAEVNVHVSVRAETLAWDDVADDLRREGIQPSLDQIRRAVVTEVREPLL